MREDQSELMLAQAKSGIASGANRAKGRDGKNNRDLDAEMRKRRLAKNALLAVGRRLLMLLGCWWWRFAVIVATVVVVVVGVLLLSSFYFVY